MIEEKDEATPETGAMPANDAGGPIEEGGGVATADDRLVALEGELADVKDRLLRALAETENTRRRAQREREDLQKYATAGFARDLLSPVDNLRRALESVPEAEVNDPKLRSLLDGVAATERELLAALERHGVKRIDPKGEKFDHNFHQAIFEAENSGQPAGTVVEVLQPGYALHDRLLRPAMVGVAKAGAPAIDQKRLDELWERAIRGKAGGEVTHSEDAQGKRLAIGDEMYEKRASAGIWERVLPLRGNL